jgi:hypothetical protein
MTDTLVGTNAPTGIRAFRLITERNIFDSTRRPRTRGQAEPRDRSERAPTFTLVGTMTYDKGPYAFFDGSGSEFKKALSPGQKIAGFTVAQIDPDTVKLTSASTNLNLTLGTQLRREGSDWKVVPGTGQSALTPASSGSDGTSSSTLSQDAEADIVKRLMRAREEESK